MPKGFKPSADFRAFGGRVQLALDRQAKGEEHNGEAVVEEFRRDKEFLGAAIPGITFKRLVDRMVQLGYSE